MNQLPQWPGFASYATEAEYLPKELQVELYEPETSDLSSDSAPGQVIKGVLKMSKDNKKSIKKTMTKHDETASFVLIFKLTIKNTSQIFLPMTTFQIILGDPYAAQ